MTGATFRRAMPEGFEADAFAMSSGALRKKYRCSAQLVMRWRNQVGDPRPDLSEPPADLRELAQTMCARQLRLHYGVGHARVTTWLKKLGITAFDARHSRPWQVRPCPEDFARVAPTMTKKALREHYRTHDAAINRWLAECNVQSLKPEPGRGGVFQVFRFARGSEPHVKALRNYDKYDEAADFMRHYGPCYRCDENGKLNERGKFWRFGNVVLNREELLERAENKRRRLAA